jgi:hypothetical protein
MKTKNKTEIELLKSLKLGEQVTIGADRADDFYKESVCLKIKLKKNRLPNGRYVFERTA